MVKRKPEKKIVVRTTRSGIGALHDELYAKMSDNDRKRVILNMAARTEDERDKHKNTMYAWTQREDELTESNQKGATVRAERYSEKKQVVQQVYRDLKAKLGKAPSKDLLHNTLIKLHGAKHYWSGNTLSKWIAKLNKGEDL